MLPTAVPFSNAGKFLVQVNSGFQPGGAFTQTAGATTIDGVLNVPKGMNIQRGLLFGKGTIVSAIQSGGTVTPGDSTNAVGKLTVTGSYTQSATGALNISIGGTTVGIKYDQLAVSNGVSLNGTLNITRIKGFTPAIGNTFTIPTGSVISGTFATVNGLSINSSEHFEISYKSTNVALTVVASP